MVAWPGRTRCGPIGVDIGSRSVKLLQLSADRTEVVDSARWDLPTDPAPDEARHNEAVAEAIRRAREGRDFRGREAVFCLGGTDLFVQNIRVAPSDGEQLERIVQS